jgi:hypothetical protein
MLSQAQRTAILELSFTNSTGVGSTSEFARTACSLNRVQTSELVVSCLSTGMFRAGEGGNSARRSESSAFIPLWKNRDRFGDNRRDLEPEFRCRIATMAACGLGLRRVEWTIRS